MNNLKKIRLGRTNLYLGRSGFGAIPIQRVDFMEAKKILWKAYDNGIDFFDTARSYTNSEEKIGTALSFVRDKIYIATKSKANNKVQFLSDLEDSLAKLKTEYVDIMQIHNPVKFPDTFDPNSNYAGLVEAKMKGKVRFVGITTHKLEIAEQAIKSGLFDTVQYPLSVLSSKQEESLTQLSKDHDVGFIAMKVLAGGLIDNVALAFSYINQFNNVVPIWGVQKMEEIDEFIAMEATPPFMDKQMKNHMAIIRKELSGNFCRGCGYCLPCPAGIPIDMAARMPYLLKRYSDREFLNVEWKRRMELINDCLDCGQCSSKCPYDLEANSLLRKALDSYLKCYHQKW